MHCIPLLMAVISFPIMLLNILGGIVGGVWLGVAGEWWTLGLGVVGIICGAFFCSLLMFPGMSLTVAGMGPVVIIRLIALPHALLTYALATAP